MPHSYRGRTPSPLMSVRSHQAVRPQSQRNYVNALLADEQELEQMYEPSVNEIMDRNRKSYSLPLRQQLQTYDDLNYEDYEIPDSFYEEQDPYHVKQNRGYYRPIDQYQADVQYDRVHNRPQAPGLSPRRNRYQNDYHEPHDGYYGDHGGSYRPPSSATRRSQSAMNDLNDGYFSKQGFSRNRKYHDDEEFVEYDDDEGGHESLNFDYDARRRSYGYASASPEITRRPSSRSSRLPPSGRRSRGNRDGCYDDGYRTASNPRFEGIPPKIRRSSRMSYNSELTNQRSRSRVSNYDSLPPRHPSRASNFESLPRQPSRQSDFPHGRSHQSGSPQRRKFERRSSLGDSIAEGISVGYQNHGLSRQHSKGSLMFEREIPEEETKEEEEDHEEVEEEVPEVVEEPEHFEFEEEKVPDKEYEFDDDDSFDAEQEIKMMLKQGKSLDRVLPEPFMKSFYVYKTRGPDKLEMFERDDEILDFDREATYRPPTCDIKLRSHTVWEKMYVKFTCTVKGKPLPKITWYKNMIPIDPMNDDAGHIKMTSQYGVHTLEIFRTSLEDSGTYRISAQNCKGEVSSFATLVVKRYIPGRKSLYPSKSFDDAKLYGATSFNDEDETQTIRKLDSDVTKNKMERQSSAVIEYKPQKSVEELAEEGANFVESDEYKEAQKKKDKEGKKKKNKVSFQDEDKKDKSHGKTEKKGKKR